MSHLKKAQSIDVDTTGFTGGLSGSDTDVQEALNTIDGFEHLFTKASVTGTDYIRLKDNSLPLVIGKTLSSIPLAKMQVYGFGGELLYRFLSSSGEGISSLDQLGVLNTSFSFNISTNIDGQIGSFGKYAGNTNILIASNKPGSTIELNPSFGTDAHTIIFDSNYNLRMHSANVGDGEGVLSMDEVVTEPTNNVNGCVYVKSNKLTYRNGSGQVTVVDDLPVLKEELQSYTLSQRTPTVTDFGTITGTTVSVLNLKATDLIEIDAIINISCNIVTPVKLRISDGVTPGYTYTITPPNSRTDGLDVVVPLKALYTGLVGTINFRVEWAVATTAGNPTIYAENKHIVIKVFQQR